MKICKLVLNCFPPDTRVLKEAVSLSAAGHDVTILAVAKDDLPREERVGPVRVVRLPLTCAAPPLGASPASSDPRPSSSPQSPPPATPVADRPPPQRRRPLLAELKSCGKRNPKRARELAVRSRKSPPIVRATRPLAWVARPFPRELRRNVRLCLCSMLAMLVGGLEMLAMVARWLVRAPAAVLRAGWRFPRWAISTTWRALRVIVCRVRKFICLGRKTICRGYARHLGAVLQMRNYGRSVLEIIEQERPDVIHAHDLLTLWAGAQAARRTGAHLVYDAHEMEWDCNRIQRKWLLRIVWRIHEAALVRLADLHVTVSPRIAELYRRRYRIAQPIVLPNAPCRSWAGEGHSAPSLYEQIPHIGDKTVLMFVGSVTRDRGIHTMLEALALLPEEFVLVALGRVVPAVHDELHAYSTRLGVRHRFFELPPVEYRAVPDVVGEADIGLIPVQPAGTSYRYCMPNKLFELMHAGLPIVTGKLPDVAAVVTSNGLGVVCDQESPEDLARAIRHVAERRETFAPGPERIEQIRDAYCWEAYAGELVMAYAALDRRAPRVGGRRSLLSGYLRPRNWMMAWWSGPDADAADLPVGLPPGSLLPARRRPSNRPSRELVAQGRD